MSEKTMTQSLRDALERLEQLREPETEWLAKSLSGSISNLGYPVGCGIAPDPDALSRAANVLFDRFVQVHTALISAPAPQQGECSECDGKGFIEINGFLDVCQACDGPATPPTSATVEAATIERCAAHIDVPYERKGSEFAAALRSLASQPAQPQAVGAERVAKISAALAVLQQDYSPECLEMASTREYVEDAVSQLIDAGYSPTAPQAEAQAGETPRTQVLVEHANRAYGSPQKWPLIIKGAIEHAIDLERELQAASERAERLQGDLDVALREIAELERENAQLRAELAEARKDAEREALEIHYRDYRGSVEWSAEDGVYHGKILGITDLVTYECTSLSDIELVFAEACNDYETTCRALRNPAPDQQEGE